MVLSRSKIADLPPDAIVLTKHEAATYQMKIFTKWPNYWEVFAVKFGSYILGCTTFGVASYYNSYFRQKFKLGRYGRFSTFLPVCLLPGTFSFILHQELVLKEVLVATNEACPVCLEVRSSSIQGLLGGIAPVILAPGACVSIATMYHTYNVPYIKDEPRKLWELIKQKSKPMKGTFIGIFAAQMLLASVITYFEFDSVYRVHKALSQSNS